MIIDEFSGKYKFLCNFSPALVTHNGIQYPTSEHAYQAAKFIPLPVKRAIAQLPSPYAAKQRGQSPGARDDWDRVKVDIMREIIILKFWQNPLLLAKLVSTGKAELVEGNKHGDIFWGVYDGRGSNHLGRILMDVRELLRK